MADNWDSPHLFVPGDSLSVDTLRLPLGSLEAKFRHGITGADFDTTGGKFQIPGTLDLMGHDLKGAKNVPSGIANVRSFSVLGTNVDEGPAIQSALERIRGQGYGVAFFPAGIYKSTTAIRVPPNLAIWGGGPATEFRQESSDGKVPFFRVIGDSATSSTFYLGNCRFDHSPSAYDKNIGVQIENPTKGAIIENVVFSRYAIGVQGSNGDGFSVKSCFSDNCLTTLQMSKCSGVFISGIYAESQGVAYEFTDVTGFSCVGIQVVGSDEDHGAVFSGCRAGMIQGMFKHAKRSGLVLKGCSSVNVIAAHCLANAYTESGTPERYAGILLDNCSGCGVKGCVSIDENDASSYQSYGVEISSGAQNMVIGCVLTPNKGPNGTTSSDDPSFAVLDKGTGTLLVGVQKVSF